MMFGGVMMMQRHAVSGGGTPPAGYFGTLPSIGSGGTSGASGTGVAPLLAFDPSLLTGANGSALTTIPDQCGSGAVLTANGSPSLSVSGLNGKNAISFPTQYDFMQTGNIASILNGFESHDFTMMYVSSVTNYNNGSGQSLGLFDASDNFPFYFLDNNGGQFQANGPFGLSVANSGPLTSATIVRALVVNRTAGAFKYTVNGVSASTTSISAVNPIVSLKLNRVASGGYGITGLAGELVIWPTAATDAQVSALMTQQHAKWG